MNSSLRKFKVFLNDYFPLIVIRTLIFFGKTDRTYAGELESLKNVLQDIETSLDSKKFLDIGSGDGFTMSSSYFLAKNNWSGILIDSDFKAISRGYKIFRKFSNISFLNININPHNILREYSHIDLSDLDYLKIDIDSYDGDLLRGFLEQGIKPPLISIEINERFPPNLYFETKYQKNFEYKNKVLYGISISCAIEIAKLYSYKVYCLEYNNLFLIRSDIYELQNLNLSQETTNVYMNGYFLRRERDTFFPWNMAYLNWHNISKKELIEICQNLSKDAGMSGVIEIR